MSLKWLPESMPATDDEPKPGKASWKDQVVLGHMATSHGFDAVIEAGRRRMPGPKAEDIDVEEIRQTSEPPEVQLFSTGSDSRNAIQPPPRIWTSIDDYRDRVLAESFDETLQRDRKRARVTVTRQARPASQPEQRAAISRRRDLQIQRRKVLPMVLENDGRTFSMSACPDSGSDVNVISLSAAKRLGCEMEPPEIDISKFCLANGQPTGAIGRVAVDCSFATGTPWHDSALSCVFHVFSTLAVPLIMGMQFLERTETFSKYQDRLVEELAPSGQAIRINSVGRPLKSLVCQLDGCNGLATADTGADLDFLSDNYARSRGFTIEEAYHELILANGSLALTCGVTCVPFVVGQVDETGDFVSKSQIIEVEFFILENLSSDILIGQDTVLDLNIFTDHAESFIASDSHAGESVNILRYKGKLEKAAANAWRKLRGVRGGGDDIPSGSCVCHIRVSKSPPGFNARLLGPNVEREWELDDQRENSRREVRKAEIFKLYGEEKACAEAEETRRVQHYDAKKGKRRDIAPSVSSPNSFTPRIASPPTTPNWSTCSDLVTSTDVTCDTPFVKSSNKCSFLYPSVTILTKHRHSDIIDSISTASFVCAHPGCNASPFQTQYLLNA